MKVTTLKEISLKELAKITSLPEELIMDCNTHFTSELCLIPNGSILEIPLVYKVDHFAENKIINVLHDTKEMKKYSQLDTILETKTGYTSTKLYNDLNILIKIFPFIKKETIGESVLGKPIIELSIGKGPKRVHMNGSFHANEWITSAIMMKWLEEYVRGLTTQDELFQMYSQTTLSFVPMVNPDGVDLVLNGLQGNDEAQARALMINEGSLDFSQWKANIRGIDLNNQYPANWEIEKIRKIPKSPAPRDYPGDAPLTEPEAITMANLLKERNFDRILAFHTQGEEIYWGYMNKEPQEAEAIVQEFEKLSGYKAVQHIDSHAGFRDWFVNEWGRPGFTIELGNGVNPLPLTQFEEIYQKSKEIFFAGLYM